MKARPMMQFYAHDLFKPYVVYDVSHGRDRTASAGSGSRWNLDEINMALALFQELRQYLVQLMQKSAKEGTARPQPCTVGIITPYRYILNFFVLQVTSLRCFLRLWFAYVLYCSVLYK